MINKRIGKLVVKRVNQRHYDNGSKERELFYSCYCDCGNAIEIPEHCINHGEYQRMSCGCEFGGNKLTGYMPLNPTDGFCSTVLRSNGYVDLSSMSAPARYKNYLNAVGGMRGFHPMAKGEKNDAYAYRIGLRPVTGSREVNR